MALIFIQTAGREHERKGDEGEVEGDGEGEREEEEEEEGGRRRANIGYKTHRKFTRPLNSLYKYYLIKSQIKYDYGI